MLLARGNRFAFVWSPEVTPPSSNSIAPVGLIFGPGRRLLHLCAVSAAPVHVSHERRLLF